MNKLANMRHWQERMSPSFGMSRSNMGMPAINSHPKVTPQGVGSMMNAQVPPPSPIYLSFNVPFASDLAGPDTEDILHATQDAVLRWTHPETAPDDVPVYDLPVHAQHLANLRMYCKEITQSPAPIEAAVISTTPKHVRGQVTTVCLAGLPEVVYKTREQILNDSPLSLVRVLANAPCAFDC